MSLEQAKGQSVKILIVDDLPTVRMILREMLGQLGFQNIFEAEDGDHAWNLIQEALKEDQAFELILSDWNMPGVSGVDLLRQIRGMPVTQNLPVLMITAEGDQAHFTQATLAGVNGYIVKPFELDQLREKLGPITGI